MDVRPLCIQGIESFNYTESINTQRFEPKKEDRFALPTASIIKSRSGKLSYGLPDRLCCKPFNKPNYDCIRHILKDYNPNTAAIKSNQSQELNRREGRTTRTTEHRPIFVTHERRYTLQQMPSVDVLTNEMKTSTAIDRGRLRCVRTAYGNRVNDSSKISEALTWNSINTQAGRPKTSDMSLRTCQHRIGQQGSQTVNDCKVPPYSAQRFAARNAQQVHQKVKLEAAEYRKVLLDMQRTLQLLQSQARQREKSSIAWNASNEWPHGLPVARRNSAFHKGVRLGGLGYGQGVHSLPQPEYVALK